MQHVNNEACVQILNPEDNSEYTTDAILRGVQYSEVYNTLTKLPDYSKRMSCCSIKRPAMMDE